MKIIESMSQVIELNGRLSDCIIEVTENIYDNKILNLFEELARLFNKKNIQDLDKGEMK